MKAAFISGVRGQDGAYLAQLLLEKGYHVHGGVRGEADAADNRLMRLGIDGDVQTHEFDLTDPDAIVRLLDSTRIDEFYNLAAQSFVGTSWDRPIETVETNGVGVVRILDGLRSHAPDARFYQASTSEMFGQVQEIPQRETTRFYPRSPYGAAKAFAHYITRNYRESYGMHASSGILFNHESPLRGPEFVTRKITLGLAAIAHGGSDPIRLGNLDARRDWGFAGDYVRGIWMMLQQDVADDYVLATGVTSTIRDFVSHAADALDFDLEWSGEGLDETATDRRTGRRIIEVAEEFFRPAEVDVLIGDATKAREVLGWTPQVEVRGLAQIMAKSDYDALA